MATVTRTQTIRSLNCGGCGVLFGLESSYMEKRQDDGKYFRCPNGCQIGWDAVNKAEQAQERLRLELDAARSLAERESRRRAAAQAEARTADYQRRATKGQLTKTRKRIAAGVCPCCNRTFANLANHMAGQHPDYAETTP